MRLRQLETSVEDPALWGNPARAQRLMQECTSLRERIESHQQLEREASDQIDFATLAQEEGDEIALESIQQALAILRVKLDQRGRESMLSGELDDNDCFVEIHAGSGGTDAQDWAVMLVRMYTRWAEQRGYRTRVLDQSFGEEAGVKSAAIQISGRHAFGWLSGEAGVHRLVRISPFDSQARRHTSFASVWVSAVIDDSIEVNIQDKDLRVDTYRASGAGGQHVNKTDSAVRITHLPTNTTVQCQQERSQHKNRAAAMAMLRARLYALEQKKRDDEMAAQAAQKSDITWGSQIRSYVLQPYQQVKDLRTGVEVGNVSAVLDGQIDIFLESALAARSGVCLGNAG